MKHIDGIQPKPKDDFMSELRGAVARGWTHKKNEHKEMDVDLAEAITIEVEAMISAWIRHHDFFAETKEPPVFDEFKTVTCIQCGGMMVEVYKSIGGIPGHEHAHPGEFLYFECNNCGTKLKRAIWANLKESKEDEENKK